MKMMVIYLDFFETLSSGCFRAFPINYVTSKSDSPGWGFRTGKGFLAQKYISCQLPPVPFHFLTWGSGRPIKTEANIISTSIFGLLLSFLGSRLICFECDLLHQPWHKGWSIYQKEVRRSKQISAKNRLRQEMGSKQCQKNVKQMWCQDALLSTFWRQWSIYIWFLSVRNSTSFQIFDEQKDSTQSVLNSSWPPFWMVLVISIHDCDG